MDEKSLSHNNKPYFTYLFQELLSFNNNGLIQSITLNNGAYPTKRKIKFMSSQYSYKITNEPEEKFKSSKMSIN